MEVNLSSDSSSNASSSCGNSRDDITRDHLSLVAVGFSDLVVPSSEVGAGMDEVNVEVGIIILLKVSRNERHSLFHRNLRFQLLDLLEVSSLLGGEINRLGLSLLSLLRGSFACLLLFRNNDLLVGVGSSHSCFGQFTHLVLIAVGFHTLVNSE